jgi:NAD(P) transhydrogenase subunit alpha
MDPQTLPSTAYELARRAAELSMQAQLFARQAGSFVPVAHPGAVIHPIVFLLAIFVMACFVGYYVVWNVTPALHSPLMAVTNAISSVIIVGAMLATGLSHGALPRIFGFLAVVLASVNIFGGFAVTQRMLSMFRANKPARPAK